MKTKNLLIAHYIFSILIIFSIPFVCYYNHYTNYQFILYSQFAMLLEISTLLSGIVICSIMEMWSYERRYYF